jgi:hypothetical protein
MGHELPHRFIRHADLVVLAPPRRLGRTRRLRFRLHLL